MTLDKTHGRRVLQTTPTHWKIGLALGSALFPFFAGHDILAAYAAEAGCTMAAIAPDVPFFFEFKLDERAGRPPMKNPEARLPLIWHSGEALHSIPVWIVMGGIVYSLSFMMPFVFAMFLWGCMAGWASHIIADTLSHGGDLSERGKYLAQSDVSYLYPCNLIFPRMAIRLRVAEYRIDHGIRWPLKPFEQKTNSIANVIIVLAQSAYVSWLLFTLGQ